MAEQQDGNHLSDDVINDELTALSRAALKPAAETNDAGSVSVNVNDSRLETLQVMPDDDPGTSVPPSLPEGAVSAPSEPAPDTGFGAFGADPIVLGDADLGAAVGSAVGAGANADMAVAPGGEAVLDGERPATDPAANAGRDGQARSAAEGQQGVTMAGGFAPADPNTGAVTAQAAVTSQDMEQAPTPDAAPAPGDVPAQAPDAPAFADLPDLQDLPPVPDGPDGLGETVLSGIGTIPAFTGTVTPPPSWTAPTVSGRSFEPADLELGELPGWQPASFSTPELPDLANDHESAPDYGSFSVPNAVGAPGGAGTPVQFELPSQPAPAEFRPEITAGSGLIVFDSAGDMVNPPDESEMWEYIDPFSGQNTHVNPEYINGTKKINNLTLKQDFPVSVTFVGEGAGHKNALGYYKIGEDGTISDVSMIWENASGARKADVLQHWKDQGADDEQLAAIDQMYGGINEGGDLVPGQSTVELPNLSAGDSFGFFIVSNGYNNHDFREAMESGRAELSFRDADGNPAKVSPDTTTAPSLTFDYVDDHGAARSGSVSNHVFHTAANGDTLGLNTSGMQQAMSGVVGEDKGELGAWGVNTGDLLIGFEDLARPGGDSDFNDLVFRLNIDPVFIDSLETVSTEPTISLGHGDSGDTLDRAVVSLDNLDGAVFAFDGWNGTDPEGTVTVDGHEVSFKVDRSGDDQSATITFETADLAPPSVFETVLDSVAIDKFDANGDPLSEGDRQIAFQVSGTGGDSDIVQSVVRIAHNPDQAANAPSPTVIKNGPSNIEIAADHEAAMDAWAAARDQIDAANSAIADAHGAVESALDTADTAYAAYDAAHTGLTQAVAAADTAIAEAQDAWTLAHDSAAAMVSAHETLTDAQTAVTDAVGDHDAAVAAANAAYDTMADVRDQAVQAIDTIETLETEAQSAHDTAVAAEAVYDDAVQAVAAAETQAMSARMAAEAAREEALSARDDAIAARQAVEDKAGEIASARAEVSALADAASATQASITELTQSAADQRQAIDGLSETVANHQTAVGQAHEALSRDPGRPDLQARYDDAVDAHAGARGSLDEAVQAYNDDLGRIEALNETLADQKAGIDAAQEDLAELVGDYEALAANAETTKAGYEAANDRFETANSGYEGALDALTAVQTQADAAGYEAEQAWSAFGQAAEAYDQAVAMFETAIVPAYESVRDDFHDAVSVVESAEAAVEAAQNDYAEALDAFQQAEAAYDSALDAYRAAADAADAEVESVEAAALLADAAYEGYRDAMADAADAADDYADLVADHGGTAPDLGISVPPETDAYKPATILGESSQGEPGGAEKPFPDAPSSGEAADDGGGNDLFTFDDGTGEGSGGSDPDPAFDGGGVDDSLSDCDTSGLETCV